MCWGLLSAYVLVVEALSLASREAHDFSGSFSEAVEHGGCVSPKFLSEEVPS